MQSTRRIRRGIAMGALLGGALLVGGALATANAEETGTPAYGPGMMGNYAQPPTGNAYGPGMMRGYGPAGQGGYGYGYGPGMMAGYGHGAWGGYGPGMMAGYGHGAWGGYGPGMMAGYGHGAWGGYGPGMMPGGFGWGMMGDPGMMGGFGYGAGGWGGYGPSMMRGYGGWGWRGGALKLSGQQRQRLDEIHAKSSKQLWSLMGQMQEERFALARLMISSNPDMKAVDAAYDKLSQTGKKLLNLRLDTRRASLEVLTADQRKELEEQGWQPTP